MVQFYVLFGYYQSPRLWLDLKYKDGILKTNKEIRNNFYHSISRNLWDKLIKRETYIKSIKFMREDFYNQIYYINNDDTVFFGLLYVTETFGFLEQIGYFYILRPKGEYNYRNDPKNMNLIFRSIFNILKYFYIQSDNNFAEKINLAYNYFDKNYRIMVDNIAYLTEGFDFLLDVIDLYINSPYFFDIQIKKLSELKSLIIDRKKEIEKA